MHCKGFMSRFLFIIFFVFIAGSSSAQFRDSSAGAKAESDSGHFHMAKSPTLALVLSAVLPGAGQVYTGGWYKAPFIVGGIAGCLIAASIQNGRYLVDIDSINNQLARKNFADSAKSQAYVNQREFYRDDRDKFYIYAGLVYIANLLDAYISAHLFDFDVSEPSGAYLEAPRTEQEPWRLAFRMRF
jgi:hypothetical protein